MDINSLTIGEAKKIADIFGHAATKEADPPYLANPGDTVIVVLQRGHIAVGKYYQTNLIATLCGAAIIRRWGTTEGIGELAKKGPLANTKLDKCPNISFHIREAVMAMEVDDAAWRDYTLNY